VTIAMDEKVHDNIFAWKIAVSHFVQSHFQPSALPNNKEQQNQMGAGLYRRIVDAS
jgi:prephenate dehydrogenase